MRAWDYPQVQANLCRNGGHVYDLHGCSTLNTGSTADRVGPPAAKSVISLPSDRAGRSGSDAWTGTNRQAISADQESVGDDPQNSAITSVEDAAARHRHRHWFIFNTIKSPDWHRTPAPARDGHRGRRWRLPGFPPIHGVRACLCAPGEIFARVPATSGTRAKRTDRLRWQLLGPSKLSTGLSLAAHHQMGASALLISGRRTTLLDPID